ncbi:DUF535 domain-containing protein [Pseudomonas oryziphila]|uniref:DUF535 domain-containing protein n=2 Tax=Pseudomonas oryziphila TaxID=2894079 RepID=A0ABN5TKV2_9PSED|nr:DUF535 domain-containing protein [Pseudomonas oryziphila]
MAFRSLLKSVLTLQPGYSLRALNNKFKLLVLIITQWTDLRPFLRHMEAALGKQGFDKLGVDCIGMVQWPYVSKCWSVRERLDAVASHYQVVTAQFPTLLLLGRDERRTLCDLSGISADCTLVLDRPIWFKREGELVLNLFQGDLRVASLAFTLQRTAAGLCLFIGAVQGIHKGIDSERSLAIYRDLTKDFEGLRPRSLLLEALKCLARAVGADGLYAVGDAYRHHRHPYFGAEKSQDLAANYDAIWLEHGAVPSEREDFFSLPLAAAQRAAEDIAPKKRAMYRRRQALLEALFAQLEAALAAGADPMQVHRQRLGYALVLQEASAPTAAHSWLAKAAGLFRQALREPRADQRFVAYIRKAGLYPTLRKTWRELLRHGPALLWKPPAEQRHDLPLDAPGVAASTLFPGHVLLICESDPVQALDGRPAQLRQMLVELGYTCTVADWRNPQDCLNALQTCAAVILHRLPYCAQLSRLLEEASRLKVTSCWDTDELIFDPQAYRQGNDLNGLRDTDVGKLMAAVALHRQALLACECAIASSAVLAAAMQEAGARQVTVVECSQQLGQVFPALSGVRPRRLLSANIFFAPRSFGGATVVAEQMARLLAATSPWQQFVFTSLPTTDTPAYSLFRYQAQQAAVLGIGLPDQRSALEDFENRATLPLFDAVLERVAPDLVHLHSIQGLGALLAESCARAGIPFVVTLHDAWWICGRQFMINGQGQYCGQTRIRAEVCAACVEDAPLNAYRQQALAATLRKASLLLAPSRFARDLYVANGFDAAKIRINRNGILAPGAGYHKQPGALLRFGFVGGNTAIKGINLITQAFAGLPRSDYELKVVDNLLHLGFRSFNRHSVKIPGRVSIIPGYTQDDIDAFFSGIDVLLFPTQWKETFGLAVREALVRDVWVISTDAGGTVEDIVDGVNGTIIPLSSDPRYLREALADALEHPERFAHPHNAFKGSITLCSDQALELQGIYADVIAGIATADPAPSAMKSLK